MMMIDKIVNVPKCPVCGKDCHLHKENARKGYTKYCSNECRNIDKERSSDYYPYLSNRDWLYNQRVVLRKSKEQIGKELGCSYQPVAKWIKRHQIEDFNLTENPTAKNLLNNRDWLINEYKTKKQTLADIGNKINCSDSFVSKFIRKHGIESTPPNTYDRAINNWVSTEEKQVVEYIKSIYPGVVETSVRRILNGNELDIYIPDKKIAIEYNGLYSHAYRPWEKAPALIKGADYHISKTVGCLDKGITLYHIFSDEWGAGWKNLLRNKLGCDQNRVMARKCKVQEIGVYVKNDFLNSYHIQGADKSRYKYGLYHDNILVAVMTFGQSRFNRNYDFELIRYCVKDDYNVIGGFSKLLSHFKKQYPDCSIVSYADRRYSDGGVYLKNGFKLIHTNKPNYKYISKDRRHTINRMKMQKRHLLKELNRPDWTEEQIAYELGYMKIFDCGTYTFVCDKRIG